MNYSSFMGNNTKPSIKEVFNIMKLSNRWMLMAVMSIIGLTLLTINAFAMGGNTPMSLNSPQNNCLAEKQLLINGKTAEETILLFMKEKGINAEKGTKQYLQFMRDILLGEYPELTRLGSKYLGNQRELDLILEYITEQRSPLFKDFPMVSFSLLLSLKLPITNQNKYAIGLSSHPII